MPGQPRYPDFRFPFHGSPCGKRASLPCQKTFSGGRSVSPGVLLCRKAGEKAIPFLTREAPAMPRSVWNTSGASSRRKSGQAAVWMDPAPVGGGVPARVVGCGPYRAPSRRRGRSFLRTGPSVLLRRRGRLFSLGAPTVFAVPFTVIRPLAVSHTESRPPVEESGFHHFFERCLSGGALARCPAGTGGRENPAGKAAEPRLSGEPADRAGRLWRDCPGWRGDWTPGRFGRATRPCSKTA